MNLIKKIDAPIAVTELEKVFMSIVGQRAVACYVPFSIELYCPRFKNVCFLGFMVDWIKQAKPTQLKLSFYTFALLRSKVRCGAKL